MFAALASVAALAVLPASASAGVTEFDAGLTPGNAPADITAGPDGNLWFTQRGVLPGIGTITPAGAVTEYPVAPLQVPGEITTGPDGALWFTERGPTDAIARIEPATGTITDHSLPGGSRPTGIAAGADGNLWFTERSAGKIGRMTPAGELTEFSSGLSGGDTLNDIAAGPDGKLWFTVEHDGSHRIGSIDPYDPHDPCFYADGLTGAPNQITAASDGKLYFTETGDPAAIGHIRTSGLIKEYRSGLTADSAPAGVTEGGDGALWFTGGASPGRLGRLWPSAQAFSEFAAGSPGIDLTLDSTPAGITRGPDGNVWFTESAFPGRIGRITVPPRAELEITEIPDAHNRHTVGDGKLEATIAANSQATTYHVEYGPDAQYGKQSQELSAGAAAEPVTEVVELALAPDSHYHARLVATNGAGQAASSDVELWVDANGRLSDFEPEEPGTTPTPIDAAAPEEEPEEPEEPSASSPGDGASDLPAGPAAPVAPPVLGKAVVVRPLSGSVLVKTPGAADYRALDDGAHLPVGTMVDTREGRITLQSARNAHGNTQSGTFWGGVFQIRQRRRGRGMTDLFLRGGRFGACGQRAGASALARTSGRRGRAVRRLWGRDKHSRFRTHGRDSVATVRGTEWVTTDRCDGTLTKVTEGQVLVRDLHRKRNVLLSAGSAYLARHHH